MFEKRKLPEDRTALKHDPGARCHQATQDADGPRRRPWPEPGAANYRTDVFFLLSDLQSEIILKVPEGLAEEVRRGLAG